MKASISALLLAGLLLSLPAAAQRRQPDTPGPSALADHAARIEHDAAQDLKSDPAGYGWFVDLDLVFPKDRAEYEALGKFAIIVLASFSNDKAELPLSAVYAAGAPLTCLSPVWRDVPPGSATAKAYGTFRSDTLCALPIEAMRKSNSIKVDFAKNRNGLEVSGMAIKEPGFIEADPDPRPSPSPDPLVLEKMIEREYPGFGFRLPT